jgi:hypothetical protein
MRMTMKLIVLIAAMAMAGCAEEEAAEPTGETSVGTAAETLGGGENDRCLAVPRALKRGIAEGLSARGAETRIRTTGKLGRASAVRSEDFEKVFYVSAVIEGPDAIGTWATNNLQVGEGLIMAADTMAMEYSDWGEAAEPGSPAAEVRGLENDGAQESRDCVED